MTSSGVYISGDGALQNRRESDHAGDDIAMNQLNSNSTNQSYSSSGSNYSKNSTINKASALKGPSGKESGSEEIRFESSGNLVASNFLSSSVGRSQKQASKINEDENDSNSFFSSNKLVTGQIELKGLPPPNGTDWFKPGIFSFRSELHSGQ
jgi:hypothetical protein